MNFRIKLTQKAYFRTKKNENYHQILHIQINVDSKFHLQQIVLIFGTNFRKKYTSGQKHKKMNITIEFFIFKFVYVPIISLNWQLRFFWTKFTKKVSNFQSKTNKIDTTIEFCIFELVFVSNFTLNMFLNISKI